MTGLQDICLPLPVMDLSLAREEVVQVRLKDRASFSDKRSIRSTFWLNIDRELTNFGGGHLLIDSSST